MYQYDIAASNDLIESKSNVLNLKICNCYNNL